MDESVALNIVYLPDGITRKKAIEFSEKVGSKLPTEFVLGQDTIPHITIYQALFPTKNISNVKDVIRKIAAKTGFFEIEMNEFVVNVVKGFVWWNCQKTEQLTKIHLETIEKLNPLREGLVSEVLKNYPATEADKKDIENYGSLLIGNRYTPHLTITALKNSYDGEKALEILGEASSNFRVDRIALGYLEKHGTVAEIIEEFPLASNY